MRIPSPSPSVSLSHESFRSSSPISRSQSLRQEALGNSHQRSLQDRLVEAQIKDLEAQTALKTAEAEQKTLDNIERRHRLNL